MRVISYGGKPTMKLARANFIFTQLDVKHLNPSVDFSRNCDIIKVFQGEVGNGKSSPLPIDKKNFSKKKLKNPLTNSQIYGILNT